MKVTLHRQITPEQLRCVISELGNQAACWREWAADPVDGLASGW